ncbi:MAG: Gfo/Idh/MocA family oxidoreductase [Ginsengibacter sp.]
MNPYYNRRRFIKNTTLAGVAFGIGSSTVNGDFRFSNVLKSEKNSITGKRIGIIGLDTSHSVAFAATLNDPSADMAFAGYKIVAAYPKGSNDIQSSIDRIKGYTEDVKNFGVEIVNSIEELLTKVDAVLLETNDGRLHLEQALQVLKSGKRIFIDKPLAASLADAIMIFDAARKYKVDIFSSSSLRFITGAKEIAEGKIGKVTGADTYSPATIEKTHPDLFWYGIHGVEILFTIMGTGCKSVVRVHNDDTDIVIGKWKDDRIGTFRGMRSGKQDFGGTVFGEKAISVLGRWEGYKPLLIEIIKFFQTGKSPVSPQETLEIYAFMEAADESKRKDGEHVTIESTFEKARMMGR